MNMDHEDEIQCLRENPEAESQGISEFSVTKNEEFYVKEVESLKTKLRDAEILIKKYDDENLDLRAQLAVYKDKEKEFTNQLEALSSLVISDGAHQRSVDLQRVYDQLLYKDGRIVELNNQILEKERQIMDLQEAVREQGEVALAKSKAVQIVNQRLQEIDSRHTKDASTETDVVFAERSTRSGRKQRVNSPGRAVPQLRLGANGSPPPLDPSEDVSSYTTETATYDDPDREWSPSPSASAALNRISKKYRKKVTFDLKPPGSKKEVRVKREVVSPDPARVSMQGVDNELAQQIIDLTNENDELRRIIAEIERAPVPEQDLKIAQLEEEIENVRRNAKNQLLRTRATAQAKLKEMETKIFDLQKTQALEVDSLNATNEALKSGRDFVLEENAKLLEELNKIKQKESDLLSELDGSVALSLNYRRELDTELRRISELRQELKESNVVNQQILDEKQILVGEVEKLKDALFAQAELIKMLEGDLIVYETQVGLLRDSLGASKVETREQVKSKAVSAVSALDEERHQDLLKKRNDEKLKVKALHVKVRYLEQERDELLQWVQKHEQFEFPPRSLEDLKRLAANRGTLAPSSINSNNIKMNNIPRSSFSSILTEPTVATSFNDDNSVFNTTQNTVDDTVAELTRKLEIVQAENEKLTSELENVKSSVSSQTQGNILNLLETVEDISTAPQLNTVADVYHTPEISSNSNLENENRTLKEKLETLELKINEYEEFRKVTEEIQEVLRKEKLEFENECENLKNKLNQKEQELIKTEMNNELSIGSATEWQKEISRLREENLTLIQIKKEFEEKIEKVEENLKIVTEEKEEIEEKLQIIVQEKEEVEEKLKLVTQEKEKIEEDLKSVTEDKLKVEEGLKVVTKEKQKIKENLRLITQEKQKINENLKSIEQRDHDLSESKEKLARFEKENNKLEELVNILRSQVEQFQFEAELSRTCLEDLRKNIILKTNNIERIPSVDEVTTRTAMEALQKTGLMNVDGRELEQQPQGNLNNGNQARAGYDNFGYQGQYAQGLIQNQPVQVENYQQAPVHQPVQVENYQQAPVHQQPVQVENYQQVPLQNQSENYQAQSQSVPLEDYQQVPTENQPVQLEDYQHAGSAPPISEAYYEQQQYQQQYDQQGQQYQHQQEQNHEQEHQQYQQQQQQEHQQPQYQSASTSAIEAELNQLRSQYSQLHAAYSQMQGYYENREKDLLEEKDNLNSKLEDLTEKLTKAENQSKIALRNLLNWKMIISWLKRKRRTLKKSWMN